MTTIAWDGKTLAADRLMTTANGLRRTVSKIRDCYALAAMALGKTAAEAVRLAARFDVFTGDDVDEVLVESTESA